MTPSPRGCLGFPPASCWFLYSIYWPHTVSQNWVSVLFHCRWLCFSHPGVRQQYKATLFIFSDEYVGTKLYCWCTLLESRWAVNWETVSQTQWSSSQKELKVIMGKKKAERQTSLFLWILGREERKSLWKKREKVETAPRCVTFQS